MPDHLMQTALSAKSEKKEVAQNELASGITEGLKLMYSG